MQRSIAAVCLAFAATSPALAAPTEWRVEDGGNGHWYELVVAQPGLSYTIAMERAWQRGGHLATLTTPAENAWVFAVVASDLAGWTDRSGPWIGGRQDRLASDFSEPAGGWGWITGEPWGFSAWVPGNPSNDGSAGEQHLHFSVELGGPPPPGIGGWNDQREAGLGQTKAFVVEYPSFKDCNDNDVNDAFDIFSGTSSDVDGNGIPDECEPPAPVLGACCLPLGGCVDTTLEACFAAGGSWAGAGTSCDSTECPSRCAEDVNLDGVVDFSDLLLVLAAWGACVP